MSELPVFDAVKAVGRCGLCGRELYPHSQPNICNYQDSCPMRGDRWMAYQAARREQNFYRPQED